MVWTGVYGMLDNCNAGTGAVKGTAYNDASPNPRRWSAARVQRWLGEHRRGKFAALQNDGFFKLCDGADVCRLSVNDMIQLCPDEEGRSRPKLVFAMKCLQELASACNTGELSCVPRSPMCAALTDVCD